MRRFSLHFVNDVNQEIKSSEPSSGDIIDAVSVFQSLIVLGKSLCLCRMCLTNLD